VRVARTRSPASDSGPVVKFRQFFASPASLALLSFVAGERSAAAQDVFPSREVRIEIAIGADQSASVREQYALTRPLQAIDSGSHSGSPADATTFEFLSLPCSIVGPVTASINGRTTTVRADAQTRAPWVSLTVPPAFTAVDTGVWRLQYDVRFAGATPAVPIAMPSATLARAEGSRGADVAIDVTFPDQPPAARILIPQLHRTGAANRWTGRFLAIPSSVRAEWPENGAAACDAAIAGSAGGLLWRFAIFAGTMVTWVPLYLWWFGRKRWPDAS